MTDEKEMQEAMDFKRRAERGELEAYEVFESFQGSCEGLMGFLLNSGLLEEILRSCCTHLEDCEHIYGDSLVDSIRKCADHVRECDRRILNPEACQG